MYKYTIIIVLTLFFKISFSQNEVFFDKVYQDDIKTVKLSAVNSNFSYPILSLQSSNKLLLSFDDLNSENQVSEYYYTFIHCNSDWTQSDLFFDDYCDGFEDNVIYEFKNSFNTLQDYINFELEFPNDDIKFTKSGNYVILVYKNSNLNERVLTKRFTISENQATIEGNIRISQISNLRESCQQLNFSVTSTEFQKYNPLQYVSVSVLQNNRSDIAKNNLKPRFIKGNKLIFDEPMQNNYFAGNEFRFFNTKDVKFAFENTESITYGDDYYIFSLVPNKERKHYFFYKDINGNYLIGNELGSEPDTDADYVFVRFYLPKQVPYIDNEVYVFGELTNWNLTPEAKMEYNKDTQMYETIMFLKQGYYNYTFKLKDENEITRIDGNFYETENDYLIYVYMRDFSNNYDRLLATKVISN